FSSRRRHTRFSRDWSSDVCSSDLPALDQLEEIAEYIALDKPGAASSLVKEIFSTAERLELFPESGHVPPELPDSIYREMYVRPRSEERRVGKESSCRLAPDHSR